jgi:hypothetical protein
MRGHPGSPWCKRRKGPCPPPTPLPFWMEAAIRMGQRFYRIAAAGVPPASSDCKCQQTHHNDVCCKECGCKHVDLVDEYYFWLIPGKYYFELPNPQQNGAATSTANPDDDQFGFQDDFYSQSEQQSGWQDPTQLPQMLAWNSSPLVRLAICAEAVDLSGARVECSAGVAFYVAIMSAIQNRRVQAGTVVMNACGSGMCGAVSFPAHRLWNCAI